MSGSGLKLTQGLEIEAELLSCYLVGMLQPSVSSLDNLRLNGFLDQAWEQYRLSFQQAPERCLHYGVHYFPLVFKQLILSCSSELQIKAGFAFAHSGNQVNFEALAQHALLDKALPDRMDWLLLQKRLLAQRQRLFANPQLLTDMSHYLVSLASEARS